MVGIADITVASTVHAATAGTSGVVEFQGIGISGHCFAGDDDQIFGSVIQERTVQIDRQPTCVRRGRHIRGRIDFCQIRHGQPRSGGGMNRVGPRAHVDGQRAERVVAGRHR